MLNGHKKSPCLSHLNSADSQSPQTRKTTQKQRRKPKEEGPALAVKWLRLCTWIAGVVGSIPGGELRFHMPQCAFQKKKKKRSQCHACACYNPQPTCYPLHCVDEWPGPGEDGEPDEHNPCTRRSQCADPGLFNTGCLFSVLTSSLLRKPNSLRPSYTSQSDAREVKQTGGELGPSPSWLACVMEGGSLKPVSLSKNMGTLTSILPGRHHGNVKTYFCDSDHQSGLFN